jgi:hypothetical protein
MPPSVSEIVEQALWWLPEDTETVFVARGPFKARAASFLEQATLRDALRVWGYWNHPDSGQAAMRQMLRGRTVLASVEGSRKFRSPGGLGLMPCESCQILVLQPQAGAATTLLKPLAGRARRVLTIEGQQVLMFSEKREQDTWTIFVAAPAPGILLSATNEGFLRGVLQRRRARAARRALPDTLPEWRHMDRSAPFWGLRHYDKRNAAFDPSSPVTGRPAPANEPDNKAIGLAFTFRPERDKRARVVYLSANPRAVQIATKFWRHPSEGLTPQIRRIGADAVEVSAQPVRLFLLVLMAALGHAVYL